MRKGLLVVGVILLVLGIALAVYSQAGATTTQAVPVYPGDAVLTTNLLGPGTIAVSWSGASPTTAVELFQCTDSTCGAIASVIANVTGASGSFSGSLSSGTHYGLVAFGPSPVSVSVSLTGITLVTIIGIVLAVIGAVLAVLSLRRSKAPPAAVETTPVEQAAPTDDIYAAAPPAPAMTSGGRPNLTCSSCGAINEPWITNCRKCKRPLSSTSG